MSNTQINIYFCFPWRGVGGVSLLFLRFAEYLQCKNLANCYLIDYADGFMAKNLREPSVQLLTYTDSGPQVFIPDGALVVFQSMTPWSIYPGIKLQPDTKIFFWNCYPFNLVPLLPGLRRQMQCSEIFAKVILDTILLGYKNKVKKMISILSAKRAIAFMDRANLKTTERYLSLMIVDPIFLPVAIKSSSLNIQKVNIKRDLADCLRVIWVGRVIDFKYFPLNHVLYELNRLQPLLRIPIRVKIVGSGNYSRQLSRSVLEMTNLHCEFVDYIAPINLDSFLVENADMLIAMGTSALEGARLGIPTLLLDFSHRPIPVGYTFSWLHRREGFNLGEAISLDNLTIRNDSLSACVRELLNDFPRMSNSALTYFSANHELSKVAKNFLRAVSLSDCSYSELEKAGLLNRGLIYSFFVKIRNKVVLS